jgi:antitoxin component YwqK of YwqJK toxin-antitoxin module
MTRSMPKPLIGLLFAACLSLNGRLAGAAEFVCPVDHVCSYVNLAKWQSDLLVSSDPTLRYRLLELWRFDPRSRQWAPESVDRTELSLVAARSVAFAEVTHRSMVSGYYFSVARVDDHFECATIFHAPPAVMCVDVMIRPQPGMVAACVPIDTTAGAMLVPDLKSLDSQRCAHSGVLVSVIPRRDGIARYFAGDGRVVAEVPYQNGQAEGVMKHYAADGHVDRQTTYKNGLLEGILVEHHGAMRIEVPYHRGKMEGTRRLFDGDNRLIQETGYLDGQRHGEEVKYTTTGTVSERWMWKMGRALWIRQFENGTIVKEQDYGSDGAANGNFCRLDHLCSAW